MVQTLFPTLRQSGSKCRRIGMRKRRSLLHIGGDRHRFGIVLILSLYMNAVYTRILECL